MKKSSAASCFVDGLRLARLEATIEATKDLIKNPAPIPMRSVARGLFESKVISQTIRGAKGVGRAMDKVMQTLSRPTPSNRKKRVEVLDKALFETRKLLERARKNCGK